MKEPGAAAAAPLGTVAPRFVTARAMAISIALMPVLCLWIVQMEMIWFSASFSAISLFCHVTFVLFVLCLLNLAIERKWPRHALTAGELLTIYMMLSIVSAFCSHDLLQILIPMLAFPMFFANPQNNWENGILRYVPDWAIVHGDEETLAGLSVGNSTLYRWETLASWAPPLAFWLVFLVALMGALITINIFFRAQWTEREKLSFPIIQIPVMLATQLRMLLTNRWFWLAFGITATIDTVNGINYLFPNFPYIPIVKVFTFQGYFVERPWNVIAFTEFNLYPFVIGLTFFIPVDLAFSCWFFFIFFKLQQVVASAIGITDLPGFPFPGEQAAGGYIALGLLAIWVSRRHLYRVALAIAGRPGGADETNEPFRYRTTFLLFVLFTGVLLIQGLMLTLSRPESEPLTLGGILHSLAVLSAFFAIFFLYSLAIARMRAELGPPAHDLHAMGPDALVHNAVGTRGLGNGNITAFTMFFWFNRAYRAHFSAHDMEGYKLAQLTGITSRSITKAMFVAVVVGGIVCFWALLHVLYVHGYSGKQAGDAFSQEAWNKMNAWMVFPQRPRIAATVATLAGLCLSLVLGAMRMRFTWWAWHPVGYATSTSWSMERLWFCLFLGWLIKALIVRYGGAQLYRKALPFFVGLVMGEFTVASLWTIYSIFAQVQTYRIWG